MPTYEYRCSKCHTIFDKFESITAPTITECPKCHGSATRVISGGIGLIFKGSGFYVTDYKSRGRNTGDSNGEKKPEKQEVSSADSIPEKKIHDKKPKI